MSHQLEKQSARYVSLQFLFPKLRIEKDLFLVFGCFEVEKFLTLILVIPGHLVYRDHASPSVSLLHATRRDILMATILGETLVYSSVT